MQTAAKLAREFGEESKAQSYAAATQRIASSLPQMFDQSRRTYADVRFTAKKGPHGESLPGQPGEKTYLWDTSANFGVIWGYPNHREIELSNRFYAMNTVKLNGGMQYFDTTDPGLADLGHAVFFFTTAAPERIYLDDSDVSPASPLSWCSAEFASAVLAWSRPRVENPGRAYIHRR